MERRCVIRNLYGDKSEYIILDFVYSVTGSVLAVLLNPANGKVMSWDIREIEVIM